jgi:2-methylcitrate dehydratase PrpD
VRSKVRVTLRNGRTIEGRYDVARGHPEKPMSWVELGDKFRDCAALVLPDNSAETVLELVAHIEELRTLRPLLNALAAGGNGKKTKINKTGSQKWSRTRRA